jgi:hypothetical protein
MLSPLYGQLSPLRVPTGSRFDPQPIIDAYISNVEASDGQALEQAVKDAYSAFVIGCVNDGIWNAINASCILAGARTLNGALVPLVGSAPTNNNFVSGDYARKTGLKGNGSTKYLNSNRNNNADPQNSQHMSVFLQQTGSNAIISGPSLNQIGATGISSAYIRNRNASGQAGLGSVLNFAGMSRNNGSDFIVRKSGSNTTFAIASQSPAVGDVYVFARNNSGSLILTAARLSFYSIGESIDLAALDTRVSTLMTDLAAAIP